MGSQICGEAAMFFFPLLSCIFGQIMTEQIVMNERVASFL
jgi:hypothetical protein